MFTNCYGLTLYLDHHQLVVVDEGEEVLRPYQHLLLLKHRTQLGPPASTPPRPSVSPAPPALVLLLVVEMVVLAKGVVSLTSSPLSPLLSNRLLCLTNLWKGKFDTGKHMTHVCNSISGYTKFTFYALHVNALHNAWIAVVNILASQKYVTRDPSRFLPDCRLIYCIIGFM